MRIVTTQPCWEVQVWNGHWQTRSRHSTPAAAQRDMLRRRPGERLRVFATTRRVAVQTEPVRSAQAQAFRERRAEEMMVRRQALAYYKSGSNGTEIPSLPKIHPREETSAS